MSRHFLYYLRIFFIQPDITTPAMTLSDHRAVYNARCGHPQLRGGVGKQVFFADVLYKQALIFDL